MCVLEVAVSQMETVRVWGSNAPKTATRRLRRSAFAVALAAGLLAPSAADAQVISRFSLRGEVGAGVMISSLQRSDLGLDAAHVQVTGRLGFNVVDWLSIQLSVNNGFFLAGQGQETGRTLALQGGLRIEPRIGSVGRLWVDANGGLVSTGAQRRPGFDVGLGFEFDAARWLGLGPFARYHLVLHDSAVNAPSEAAYVSFGLSFTLRVPPDAPVLDRDHDGVLDPDDLCVDVPQGATPDPARRGCPRPDRDGDGVFDDEDRCVDVPQGATPDPARRGCPRPDTDGDGVYDDEDRCVTTPQGPTPDPDPARRGCPEGDDDNDGVLNSQDQCRTEHQTSNPDPARRGCPDPDADGDRIPDRLDRCPREPGMPNTENPARHGCPGLVVVTRDVIRITQPVFFATAEDTILPTSFPVLEAVRLTLQATPDLRRVAVEGHTDDANDDASNLDLSNRRAASVLRYLVEHGIDAGRLEAHGFGEARPLRPITDARGRPLRRRALNEARAANRRVEFRIVDPAPPAAVDPASAAPAPPPAPPRRAGRRRR
jgi:outer membrane protein OmpA-like peptidoglycan-associated protein